MGLFCSRNHRPSHNVAIGVYGTELYRRGGDRSSNIRYDKRNNTNSSTDRNEFAWKDSRNKESTGLNQIR